MSFSVGLSGISVIFALGGMAYLIFKRVSPVIAGPVAALVVILLSSPNSAMSVVEAITKTYIGGVAGFFISYFLIFLLGNIFGNLYQISGAASKIGQEISRVFGARRVMFCMIACMLSSAVLSYGGINSFVIIFAVYPIALKLFEEADVPDYMLPGIVCGGMWTFAMTGPFTPQVPNFISMENLGTTASAGLVPGMIGTIAMAVFIVIYMTWEANRAKKRGEHFTLPQHVQKVEEDSPKPLFMISMVPLLFVIIMFNVFPQITIVVWLLFGVILAVVLFWKHLPKGKLMETVNNAAASAVTININTAAIVGFGSVAKTSLFYAYAVQVLEASTANPYIVAAVGANVFAGILGSASGGLALMYSSLKDTFLAYGAQGYNVGYIHRLIAFSAGSLDTTPWNGSIVSVFAITGTTHVKSFKYNFITCGIIPLLVTFLFVLPYCMYTG
jgi:H+/gluconate symporter-like permease